MNSPLAVGYLSIRLVFEDVQGQTSMFECERMRLASSDDMGVRLEYDQEEIRLDDGRKVATRRAQVRQIFHLEAEMLSSDEGQSAATYTITTINPEEPVAMQKVKFNSDREQHVVVALGFRVRGHQTESIIDAQLPGDERSHYYIKAASPSTDAERRMFSMLMKGEGEWVQFQDQT